MRWLLLLMHLQLYRLCILSFSEFTECEFPKQWRGRWFQSGVEGLVTINGSIITGKGHCIATSGDKFLIQDQEDKCYRCMVVYERHYNVLQYKETYCMNMVSVPSLQYTCDQLRGDAILYSLFRSGAAPSPCPIKGPLEFTYSHGLNECNTPLSQAEACTQESRILLRYQACANVHSSESVDIELECLATWKEGSTQNLLARRLGSRTMKDEDSYKCFIYAKTSNDTWSVAESADAGCTGLISINEGAKVLKLKRKNPMERCMYPSWLVSAKSWVALDPVSSRLLASTYNLTILDREETQLSCYNIAFDDRRHHHHSRTPKETQVRIVAKATRDCKNGYVCLVFHKRDEYVIEMQQSEWSIIPDDVCNENILSSQFMPYKTFTASDPMTRQCPHSGHYEIVSMVMKPQKTDYNVEDMQLDMNDGTDTKVISKDMSIQTDKNIKDMTQPSTLLVPTLSPKLCFQGNGRRLNIGCKTPDRMEIATSCGNEASSEYSCHGTWIENDTAYLVASTDDGRYCIVYSASAAVAAAAAAVTASATTPSVNGQLELSVTGHLSSCPRTALHRHSLLSWQINLTSYAQCDDVSSASPWTSQESLTLLRISLLGVILLGRYIAR